MRTLTPMPMPRKTTKTEAKTTPSFVALVVFVGLVFLSLSLSWAPAPAAAKTVQAASTETGATAAPGPTPRLPNGKPDLSGTWQKPYVPDVTKTRPNHQTINAKPPPAHGKSRPATSDTGTSRSVRPTSRRSSIAIIPRNRVKLSTWVVSTMG